MNSIGTSLFMFMDCMLVGLSVGLFRWNKHFANSNYMKFSALNYSAILSTHEKGVVSLPTG